MSDPTHTDLTAEERADIDALWARRLTSTHYQILGVPRGAERKAIRDAYFAMSRRYHPDVFFNRNLGEYRPRLDEVFRMLTRAYDVLGNAKQRAGYDLHLEGLESMPPPAPTERPPAQSVPLPPPTRSIAAPPIASSRPVVPSAAMDGAVVPPPPTRSVYTAQPAQPSQPAAPPIDPAVKQRALEGMRRRLNSVVPGGSRPTSAPTSATSAGPPQPQALPTAAQRVDERDAKLGRLLSDGEDAQKRGDFEKALEHFRSAQSISKDDEAIRARAEAVDQLVKAQKTGQFIEKAREAMREGKAELAASLWEKAWEGRPTDATLLVNAAEVLAKYGNNRGKAKELAQRALSVDPKAVKAHLVLAQVFTAAGLKASARAAIDSVARLDPENPALKDLREKLGPLSLAQQLGLRGR